MDTLLKPDVRVGVKVLAVVGYGHDWAAYQGPSHWTDDRVANNGEKISQHVAEVLFPIFLGSRLRYREE